MLDIRERSDVDKWEVRATQAGALDLFIRQTDSPTSILSKSLKEESWSSIGRTLTSPVIAKKGNVTISNVRSAVIGDSKVTTGLKTYTFVTYDVSFTMVPVSHHNNYFDYLAIYQRQVKEAALALRTVMDAGCVAALEIGKTQNVETTLGPYLGLEVGSYFYIGRGDNSAFDGAATADDTRSMKEHHAFSLDVCYVTQYMSDPDNQQASIVKVGIEVDALTTD